MRFWRPNIVLATTKDSQNYIHKNSQLNMWYVGVKLDKLSWCTVHVVGNLDIFVLEMLNSIDRKCRLH